MIIRVIPSEDLTDFVWHAACAAAIASGAGNPLHCLGRQSRWREGVAARQSLTLLAASCRWCERTSRTAHLGGEFRAAIYCGRERFTGPSSWRRWSCPLLGGLLSLDHTTVMDALAGRRRFARIVAAARGQLAEWYPAEPVVTMVRVER